MATLRSIIALIKRRPAPGHLGLRSAGRARARAEDWYIEKTRLSAFYCTSLEVVLRGLMAETVLFTGVLTNQCVAATTKDAVYRDFKPIVIEECTGTTLPHLHGPAIEMMRVGWAEVRALDDALSEIHQLVPAERR